VLPRAAIQKFCSALKGERSDAVLRTAIGERSDAVLRTAIGERSDAVLRTAIGERSDAVLRTAIGERSDAVLRTATGQPVKQISEPNDTGIISLLVSLLNPGVAQECAAKHGELRIRNTGPSPGQAAGGTR
jgi:hypothetical protein